MSEMRKLHYWYQANLEAVRYRPGDDPNQHVIIELTVDAEAASHLIGALSVLIEVPVER